MLIINKMTMTVMLLPYRSINNFWALSFLANVYQSCFPNYIKSTVLLSEIQSSLDAHAARVQKR